MSIEKQIIDTLAKTGKLLKEIAVEIVTIKASLNAIEARLDNDETYKMEQNERR